MKFIWMVVLIITISVVLIAPTTAQSQNIFPPPSANEATEDLYIILAVDVGFQMNREDPGLHETARALRAFIAYYTQFAYILDEEYPGVYDLAVSIILYDEGSTILEMPVGADMLNWMHLSRDSDLLNNLSSDLSAWLDELDDLNRLCQDGLGRSCGALHSNPASTSLKDNISTLADQAGSDARVSLVFIGSGEMCANYCESPGSEEIDPILGQASQNIEGNITGNMYAIIAGNYCDFPNVVGAWQRLVGDSNYVGCTFLRGEADDDPMTLYRIAPSLIGVGIRELEFVAQYTYNDPDLLNLKVYNVNNRGLISRMGNLVDIGFTGYPLNSGEYFVRVIGGTIASRQLNVDQLILEDAPLDRNIDGISESYTDNLRLHTWENYILNLNADSVNEIIVTHNATGYFERQMNVFDNDSVFIIQDPAAILVVKINGQAIQDRQAIPVYRYHDLDITAEVVRSRMPDTSSTGFIDNVYIKTTLSNDSQSYNIWAQSNSSTNTEEFIGSIPVLFAGNGVTLTLRPFDLNDSSIDLPVGDNDQDITVNIINIEFQPPSACNSPSMYDDLTYNPGDTVNISIGYEINLLAQSYQLEPPDFEDVIWSWFVDDGDEVSETTFTVATEPNQIDFSIDVLDDNWETSSRTYTLTAYYNDQPIQIQSEDIFECEVHGRMFRLRPSDPTPVLSLQDYSAQQVYFELVPIGPGELPDNAWFSVPPMIEWSIAGGVAAGQNCQHDLDNLDGLYTIPLYPGGASFDDALRNIILYEGLPTGSYTLCYRVTRGGIRITPIEAIQIAIQD